jgi:hypothetical protein
MGNVLTVECNDENDTDTIEADECAPGLTGVPRGAPRGTEGRAPTLQEKRRRGGSNGSSACYHPAVARDLARIAMALTLGAMALTLGACSLNSAGVGSGSNAMPGGQDDGDDETQEGSGDDVEGDDDTTAGGGSATGTSGGTAPPTDDTVGAGSMDDGPGPHPAVTISHEPVFDFGPRNLSENADQAFTVTNEGDADATAVQVAGLGGPFSVVTHDCGPTLAPGAACSVQVRFDPDLFGDVETELQIAYQDQGMATSAARPIVGRGIGVTGNLLINGGGEQGNATDSPPMGWTIAYGPSWSANWFVAPPVEGLRTISAGWGPPGVNQFTLHQQIDVAALTTWGDAAGVRFYFRAFHRSETEGNDPTWVVLRFRDGGGAELTSTSSPMFSGTTWNESVGNTLAPAGTYHVQLVLECTRVMNTWCSGFYDGLEVWAEWLG